ncbi:MAG: flagellar hook-basal body complex protein FliE [Lachnospiraceae bacterium]|nr:flagellar hook-basal body complex protein FliE [Lachnospiraceae bacterium]MDD6857496.1 flagellar hook-basal body complex protein FliE [Lachnospiraceae bacterium]
MAGLDISAVNDIATNAVKQTLNNSVTTDKTSDDSFSSLLSAAMNLVNETNDLSNEAEAEQLNFAMGYSNNAHDLAIAQNKAALSLQYTVAVKNKLLEAYKEIMNIQI